MIIEQLDLIIVPHGAIAEIAKRLGTSRETVKYSLRGARTTEKAIQIRNLAIKEYGGAIAK